MKLDGSCQCGAVRFTVEALQPVPYQRCYCTICRKTAGAGGFAVNIGALADSLEVLGRDNVTSYRSSPQMERTFCGICGSALWGFSPGWPELIHPHASAIDTDLPVPPGLSHMMLGSRAGWAVPQVGADDTTSDGYPGESLADWHERTGAGA